MNVIAIKLMSGEELVGELVEETETSIVFKNPLAVMLQQTPEGDLKVGFVPFAPYLGKNPVLTLGRESLIFMEEVDERMKNQYNSVFGGIVTPPKQIITG